jgi:hypothetical protein
MNVAAFIRQPSFALRAWRSKAKAHPVMWKLGIATGVSLEMATQDSQVNSEIEAYEKQCIETRLDARKEERLILARSRRGMRILLCYAVPRGIVHLMTVMHTSCP